MSFKLTFGTTDFNGGRIVKVDEIVFSLDLERIQEIIRFNKSQGLKTFCGIQNNNLLSMKANKGNSNDYKQCA